MPIGYTPLLFYASVLCMVDLFHCIYRTTRKVFYHSPCAAAANEIMIDKPISPMVNCYASGLFNVHLLSVSLSSASEPRHDESLTAFLTSKYIQPVSEFNFSVRFVFVGRTYHVNAYCLGKVYFRTCTVIVLFQRLALLICSVMSINLNPFRRN